MRFEWDKRKCKSNINKHGIDFADITEVFNLPHLVKEDTRRDYGERRWIILGKMNDTIVIIVFTVRKNIIRIISARKANQNERKIYHERLK